MLRKSFSRFPLAMIGLVCTTGLILAGFTEMRGRHVLSQLQQGPLNVPVPGLRQSNGTSCGEAVIAMTYRRPWRSRLVAGSPFSVTV